MKLYSVIKSLLLCVTLILLVSSCHIEKRKYSKGFYFMPKGKISAGKNVPRAISITNPDRHKVTATLQLETPGSCVYDEENDKQVVIIADNVDNLSHSIARKSINNPKEVSNHKPELEVGDEEQGIKEKYWLIFGIISSTVLLVVGSLFAYILWGLFISVMSEVLFTDLDDSFILETISHPVQFFFIT